MATGPTTQVADIVVPSLFTPYILLLSEQKSRLVQSGVLARSDFLNNFLAGGGTTINMPHQNDLDDDADNVSTDDPSDLVVASFSGGTPNPRLDSQPLKVTTGTEVAVRLSRNNSWSSSDLAGALAGQDPLQGIQQRVGNYWARRLQAAFVATMNGVIADNTAGDGGDYTNDVSGGAFIEGVTNFTAGAFIDTSLTMGDSMEDTTVLMVHSVVMGRMKKNNLIDTVRDSESGQEISFFMGRQVIVDDGLPFTGNVYDSWLFGAGAVQLGMGTPKVPTEVSRFAAAGNGGGMEVLHSRLEWAIHPRGHAYTGTAPNGGPGNGTAANQLNNAGSWNRVYAERKQVKFARLVTREA